ncbi:response regulator transcription factor [Nonomuraea sp. NPDC049684]|uniref:response regulator transcription factor n=1 Tax=Nonomuraea sp. NPDC049684 TaxID=3364356 RepID=UPI0037A9C84B
MSAITLEAGQPIPASPSSLRARCSRLSVFWLAEDEVSFYGLPPLLMKVSNVAGVAVVRSCAEARLLLAGEDFDVAVIPLAVLPDVLGGRPRRARPQILAMVRQGEELAPCVAQRYGLAGCLLWDEINVAGLSGTFDRLLRGDAPVPSRGGPDLLGRLTEREHMVLALLLRGMSNHQIARSMGISIHGVKRHISNLLVKFNCSNRTEVALVAQRLGLDPAVRTPRHLSSTGT